MKNAWIVGRWRVDLHEGWISRRGLFPQQKIRPDARLMTVLKALIENAGETVATEDLLKKAWTDRVVSRDSVTTAIYQLRQLLGDSSENPEYIASIPRRGYRLIAPTAAAGTVSRLALVTAATVVIAVASALSWYSTAELEQLYVEPIQNYAESPLQEPVFTAFESTFLSELVQIVPGRVRISDNDEAAFRLQSMLVACDLGPTLVMRLLDTRSDTYVWSEAYNLDEIARSADRPTLVEQVAQDVGNVIL